MNIYQRIFNYNLEVLVIFFSKVRLLGDGFIRSLILLIMLIIFLTVLELFALAAVPAFLTSVWRPEEYLQKIISIFPNLTGWVSDKNLSIFSACVLVTAFTFKNLVHYLYIKRENSFFRSEIVRLSSRLFAIFLNSSYDFHLRSNSAALVRVVDVEALRCILFLKNFLNLAKESLMIVMISIFLLVNDPLMAVMSIFFLFFIFYFFIRKIKAKLNRNGLKNHELRVRELKSLNQGLSAIKITKIHGCESMLIREYNDVIDEREKYEAYRRLVSALPKIMIDQSAALIVISLTFFYYFNSWPIEQMLPSVALFAVAAARLVPSINMLSYANAEMRYQKPSFDQVIELLKTNDLFKPLTLSDRKKYINHSDCLSFKNVSFGYVSDGKDVLKGINFEVKPKDVVGVIGKSGSGKSTLIDLMLGLHTPRKGVISYADADIQEDLRGWQSRIGYVPQDIYLLDGTIKENIIFGDFRDSIDQKSYNHAIETSQLRDVLKSFEQGDQTIVGERGARVSGGQRQRIGIARAIYRNPELLILDEATNSLDADTEKAVLDAINKIIGKVTLVIISHNKSILKNCSFILEVASKQVKVCSSTKPIKKN